MSREPGEAVTDFTVSLPQSVDVCTLRVRISAGNSAGMSAPSEAVEVGKLQFCPQQNCRKVKTNLFSIH